MHTAINATISVLRINTKKIIQNACRVIYSCIYVCVYILAHIYSHITIIIQMFIIVLVLIVCGLL